MRTDLHASSPLLLVGRVGNRAVVIPAAAVERVVRMVALTALPEAPPGVVGVVNVQGTVLPVVDPRPRLGVETPRVHPDQHLVLISGRRRYLLWLDGIEQVTSVGSDALESVAGDNDTAPVPNVLRLEGDLLPVLSPDAFDPGPIVGAAVGSPDGADGREARPSAFRAR